MRDRIIFQHSKNKQAEMKSTWPSNYREAAGSQSGFQRKYQMEAERRNMSGKTQALSECVCVLESTDS